MLDECKNRNRSILEYEKMSRIRWHKSVPRWFVMLVLMAAKYHSELSDVDNVQQEMKMENKMWSINIDSLATCHATVAKNAGQCSSKKYHEQS